MVYAAGGMAMMAFWVLVGLGVWASLWWSRGKQGSAELPWLGRGLALGAEGMSGALLLGCCGLMAFYGYDGLIYAVGFLAGWFAGLLGTSGILTRISGGGTLAEAFKNKLAAPGAARAAAVAALVVCMMLLSAEVIAAGALLRPMLALRTAAANGSGLWVAAAGAGALLLAWCWGGVLRPGGTSGGRGYIIGAILLLVCAAMAWGIWERPLAPRAAGSAPRILSMAEFRGQLRAGDVLLPQDEPWAEAHLARVRHADGSVTTWRFYGMARLELEWDAAVFAECQVVSFAPDGTRLINGKPAGADNDLKPGGFVARLPDSAQRVRPENPVAYLAALQESTLGVPREETVVDKEGRHEVFYPVLIYGEGLLSPGRMPGMFSNLHRTPDRLNLASLMLALFGGGAVLAGIMPRRSGPAVIGMGVVGLVLALLLVVALGALAEGRLDPSDSNRTAALAAGIFDAPGVGGGAGGPWVRVLFSLIVLAVIAGTMRRLLSAMMAALGVLGVTRNTAVATALLAAAALAIGVAGRTLNAAFLAGWALNVAAAAFLPAVLALAWTKKPGGHAVAPSIWIGLAGSLAWIALTPETLEHVYGYGTRAATDAALTPWNQPAVVMVPVAAIVLLVGRLASARQENAK